MKQLICAAALAIVFCSCGNSDNKTSAGTSTEGAGQTAQVADRKLTPEEERGETLIAQNDCLGCHKIEERLQGPSYREVAQKYAGQGGAIADTLAQHIIKGHVGNWGDIPMTPHPNLSQDDAKAMVTYILSLKQ